MLLKKRDWAVLAACALLVLMPLCLLALPKAPGLVATVCVGGDEVLSLPLSASGLYAVPGMAMVVEIQEGSARICASDCPDGLCVRTGALMNRGQTALCLPNTTVLRIQGDAAQNQEGFDAITQ